MQVVNVLGHNSSDLAGAIKARQREVPATRLGVAKLILHGKSSAPSLIAEILTGQEIAKRDRLIASPQTTRRAEIGDARLGGNAGPGKREDHFGISNQLTQTLK